jgi:tripartite ATP-independent transporter DctM subunit
MTATISTIIPPGIGLILYALYANQSVGNMFMAGYLPGLLLCAALMISVNIEARKKGYGVTRAERMPGRQAAKIIIGSVWALVLPLAIILGIRFGAFTATEGGAVAAVYSLFLGIFVYKELKWKMLPGVFYEALMDTCNIMLVIVSMAAFSYYLNWEGIPLRIAYAITSISSSKWVFLLLTNLLLLVLGMFMDGSAILAIIVPIFYPIAESFGIDLIHFGLIMVFNISIGASTPPFGTLIFITTGALNVKFADFCREMWSCLIPMLIVLALITIFPFLSTFLPGIL